jgi:cytoskeletal protein CcmA (bactofilin family)
MSITGFLKASNITVDNFTVTGPVTVSKSLILKGVITGSVAFDNVTSNKLSIVGSLGANHVIISETLEIIGTLNVQNSEFMKVVLTMSESSIKNSKVKELLVKKPESERKPQKLKLYGNVHISNIMFESDQGEVHVYGHNVKLLKIKGAKVMQH